jgi:hypothetical protein
MNFNYKRLIKFEYNVSSNEKTIRMGVGAGLIFISLFLANIALLLIGLMMMVTGYVGWCPVYSGFDKNTYDPVGENNEIKPTES